MITRYPHTATVKVTTQTDSDGDGIKETTTNDVTIKGRYEPNGRNNSLDYSAKFFCSKLPELEANPHLFDGLTMFINGRSIGISKAWNYQTHCEIWLD